MTPLFFYALSGQRRVPDHENSRVYILALKRFLYFAKQVFKAVFHIILHFLHLQHIISQGKSNVCQQDILALAGYNSCFPVCIKFLDKIGRALNAVNIGSWPKDNVMPENIYAECMLTHKSTYSTFS